MAQGGGRGHVPSSRKAAPVEDVFQFRRGAFFVGTIKYVVPDDDHSPRPFICYCSQRDSVFSVRTKNFRGASRAVEMLSFQCLP